jgi:hypothetical protein
VTLDVVEVSNRLLLRHRLQEAGLVQDPHGCVDVGVLLAALAGPALRCPETNCAVASPGTTSSGSSCATGASGPSRATRCPWTCR